MGSYERQDFSLGWFPNADAFNAPKNALLRMDNCALDELGVVALRRGSERLNPVSYGNTVDSHFQVVIGGIYRRVHGSGDNVFANTIEFNADPPIATGFTGTGDIVFGANLGQIFMARGTTKKKWDGGTITNWGIAPPILGISSLSALPAGALTGHFEAIVVAVNNTGTYQALSAPSPATLSIDVTAQNIRANIDAFTIVQLDPQVNELWLFLKSTAMEQFFRFAVLAGGPWVGDQVIDTSISEDDAIEIEITLQIDNTVPPDDIIGIEGPHYDRLFVLTEQFLYPSKQLNPDSFSASEAVRVGDNTETALWLKKSREQLYVGTNRDIYRFDGDWTTDSLGEINVVKRPMGMVRPPISSTVAVGVVDEVELLVYLAGDGWRVLQGPLLTEQAVQLLWEGTSRHGVSFVNNFDQGSRFRAAITGGWLFTLTPEKPNITSTNVIHVYDFKKQRWYRQVYPQILRSIYAEVRGGLLAGDSTGYVWALHSDARTDNGIPIPVTLWTPVDDDGQPWTFKDPENFHIRLDTAEADARVDFHTNGSSIPSGTITIHQGTTDTDIVNIAEIFTGFTQQQLRITGNFTTFKFRGYRLHYLDNPMPEVRHDTGPIDLSVDEFKYVRRLRIKARSWTDLQVQPYWDGEAATPRTIPIESADTGQGVVFLVPLGRLDHGRVGRIVITTPQPSFVYWIEMQFNGTGKQNQKRVSLMPEAQ